MAKQYGRLSQAERVEIYRLHADGKSRKFIAKRLGRDPATIGRELARNSKSSRNWENGYDPLRAQKLYERRRARGRAYKLEQPGLRKAVLEYLQKGQSPEQIAGRLARDNGTQVISAESIYRYIYWRASSFKEKLYNLLPRHKSRRGWRGRKGRPAKNPFKGYVSIHQRPLAAAGRTQPGHWEADLMQFKQYNALLIAQERRSRLLMAVHEPDRAAGPTVNRLLRQFRRLPKKLRQTVTFDNGTEFAFHFRLKDKLGMETFFCDPHSPWQKGGIENAIGRLRRQLPRKTDLSSLNKAKLRKLINAHNNTPRKCLGYKTPAEVFSDKGVALDT